MLHAPSPALINRIAARALLALLLCAAAGRAFALDPSLLPSQYVLDNWQISDGLPQNTVQAVARTPDDYLWIGTQEGLARFDGVKFTVFDRGNESAIPNKDIGALFVDHAGRLWMGTRSGVAVWENGQFRTLGFDALKSASVHAFAESKAGQMWVATESGLIEIDGDHARSFGVAEGLMDERVRALSARPDGALWVGTLSGLQRFDGHRFETQPLRSPQSFIGDPGRLRQVLLNLGSNAIKFTSAVWSA